ncbi:MAG: GntR family transcriptional regulator, partial [Blastocatellia bacterium]|nr:GntR family transcriptional regulator [Blastocatellia bacterium]
MDLILTLDNRSSIPLHRQLYEQIRESILSGRLCVGASVPSTRTLAVSLGISRSTVTQSYEQLISEGYLQSVVGSGTKVSERLPDELLQAAPPKSRKTGKPGVKVCSLGLSRYGENLAGDSPFEPCEPNLPIQFQYGIPALDEFPLDVWRRLLMRQCRADRSLLLDYA